MTQVATFHHVPTDRAMRVVCDSLHHDHDTGMVTFYLAKAPVASVNIDEVRDAQIDVKSAPELSVKEAHGLLGLAELERAFRKVINRGVAGYRNANT